MDSMKYVSSPSLSSSPSTKEQSTEQPKSSEPKSMEDENKSDQKTSKSQASSKSKKQKKNDNESENNSDIKKFKTLGDEEDEEEEDDEKEEGNSLKGNIRQLEKLQVIPNEDKLAQQQERNEDQIDEYDAYEDDDDEEDDNYFYRDGDIAYDLAEDGNPNCKQKKNKFTKEFMNVIRSNSEELKNEKNDDPLDYLFVIDFECNQPGSEIIEFPITVIDLQQKKVADTFHSYVRPTKVKKLSNFIKKLTGIKQEDVDASDDIQVVLSRVEAFLSKYKNYKAAVLYDCANDSKFLSNEIRNKQLNISCKFLLSYINLRNVFPIQLTGGIKNISLSHALEVLDMSFEGQKHTGRDDAINIARVCLEMTNHQFIFTQFMKQSQFCNDNPKRLVDSTINDLFRMNKYIISIDLKFYGDKKELNTKNQMILCKSFKFHLFQIKQSSASCTSTTSPSTNQSTPQKQSIKLKTVAEKIAEQQHQQQLKQQQLLQQQAQQDAQLDVQNLEVKQSSSESDTTSSQQQQQQPNKQNFIEEIDSYSQEFNNLQYQLQEYYELLQNLIDLYHKHNIKNQNSMIILNCSTKQKYFSKFFKFITTMFKTNKTAFIFKKKILNLQDLLEKQIIIEKNISDEIIMEEFPQNVIKLANYFHSQNFEVKELPQSFQKRYMIGIPEGQQSQYRDYNSYPLFAGGSQQYGQYMGGPYSQQSSTTSNAQQQQQAPLSPYQQQQQIQQNMEYFNSNPSNPSFNQFQMMYQMQQAQNAYSQQAAAFMGTQSQQNASNTYPYYFQQAMNQMNSNIMYQMSLLNPAFNYPPNYMDSQFQQQVLYHSQQFLQQFEQNPAQFTNQSSSQSPQQQSFTSLSSTTSAPHLQQQGQTTQQQQSQATSSTSNSNHFRNNSSFTGNPNSQNFKNSQKNEGQNLSRKKNFRNNSNNFNGYGNFSNQNNNFYFNQNSNHNNTGNQSFQRNQNANNSTNSSNQIQSFPTESKHGYGSSSSNNYTNFHQSYPASNGFQKQSNYNNNNNSNTNSKNKFYKK